MSIVTETEGRLTPDQVRSAVFPAARLGRRGLDEAHVRAFCARVEEEIVVLLNERTSLFQQAEQLRQQFRDAADAAPGHMSGIAHLQAVQILANAQKTAERYVGEAQAYCRELAENARERHDVMIAEAQRHAAKIMDHADSQARSAVADASARPLAPVGDGGGFQEEAAYLRTFSEVYRTHLRAYLEALLRNLDEWGRAERSWADRTAVGPASGQALQMATQNFPPDPADR
jgi:DivIVA domain-containing protein